jgi:hypothetical protein
MPPPQNGPPGITSVGPVGADSMNPAPGQRAQSPAAGVPALAQSYPQVPLGMQGSSPNHNPSGFPPSTPGHMQSPFAHQYPQAQVRPPASSKKWLWWVVGFIALGSAIGAVVAILIA